jgi:hypothetical protein
MDVSSSSPVVPLPTRSGVNTPRIPEISSETVIDLVADLNRVGFGVLSGYLQSDDLEDIRQFVETAVAGAGGEYVVFTGEEAVAGTLLNKLSASPAFVNLLHQVYEQGSGCPVPNQSLYQVLRCLKGKSGLKHALRFHYDSDVVTALLPVIIPSQGSAGHLVMAPNRRPVRDRRIYSISWTRLFWITRQLSFCSATRSGRGCLR